MARILIVEDEPDLQLTLQEDVRRQGHETAVAGDGEEALRLGRAGQWDLILLDVMLPKMDGFDVCAALRKSGVAAPIVMLTARTQEAEKVMGLDSGADDFITKPFGLHELRARIRAQLRRGARQTMREFRFGSCEVDFGRAALTREGRAVEVTPQELRILEALIAAGGRVLNRGQLIDAAWGQGTAITDRAVDTHVFNLRKKIESEPSAPRYVVSVRGLGYRFATDSLTES